MRWASCQVVETKLSNKSTRKISFCRAEIVNLASKQMMHQCNRYDQNLPFLNNSAVLINKIDFRQGKEKGLMLFLFFIWQPHTRPRFFLYYSICTVFQCDLPPLRQHCGEAPDRDSNLGRVILKQRLWPLDHHTSVIKRNYDFSVTAHRTWRKK